MYIPTFQGLTAADFVRASGYRKSRYPFDVPHFSFYRARNAIYYLFKAMKSTNEQLTVLVPDYNSGNEVLALEAAGATIRYYPVGVDGQVDVAEVERLCGIHRADVLYVIHYLGWPQPIQQLAEISRRRGIWLVEDCALALLSDAGSQPLGTFGQWSIFCLYKTLPLPNGACLVQNDENIDDPADRLCQGDGESRRSGSAAETEAGHYGLQEINLRPAGLPSVLGRTAELVVRHIRSRSDGLGAAMQSMKRAAGRAAGALEVPRASVGDIGFNLDEVDLAMSEISMRLLKRLDFDDIREQRIANYQRLQERLDGEATLLHQELPEGVCPLLFPILVQDKPLAAEMLRDDGVDVLEFWNHGAQSVEPVSEGPNTRFLREHVLGLPIHQDLTERHIDYVAQQVTRLNLRMS